MDNATLEVLQWGLGILTAIAVAILGWLFTIQRDLSDLKGSIKNLEGRFDSFEKYAVLAKGQSPLSLTQSGVELLEQSGGKTYLEKRFTKLYNLFNDVNKGYEIQERAREIIEQQSKQKDFNNIKEHLYNVGRPIEHIIFVMSIELRDMVLEEKQVPAQEQEKVRSQELITPLPHCQVCCR